MYIFTIIHFKYKLKFILIVAFCLLCFTMLHSRFFALYIFVFQAT